jgi:hypothetical protein
MRSVLFMAAWPLIVDFTKRHQMKLRNLLNINNKMFEYKSDSLSNAIKIWVNNTPTLPLIGFHINIPLYWWPFEYYEHINFPFTVITYMNHTHSISILDELDEDN